ncbi:tryptophan 7-halogenase [Sphingobium aquiterrae]|uniref:tryptophan 7-halogenase n=1 Tax=Sphingobium aquiterrae TaxID=2038656 RepID=UPI0030169785
MTTDALPPGRVVIPGGGTAGWLAAAYLSRMSMLPSVTLAESGEIGIVGVGEGAFPPIRSLLADPGIGEGDVLPFNLPIGGEDEGPVRPSWAAAVTAKEQVRYPGAHVARDGFANLPGRRAPLTHCRAAAASPSLSTKVN